MFSFLFHVNVLLYRIFFALDFSLFSILLCFDFNFYFNFIFNAFTFNLSSILYKFLFLIIFFQLFCCISEAIFPLIAISHHRYLNYSYLQLNKAIQNAERRMISRSKNELKYFIAE